MILKSQDVFHGIVKEVRCEEEGGKWRIVSYITIEVLEVFKGEPREEIVVRVTGGTIGEEKTTALPSTNDSISNVLSNLPGVHRDSSGVFHFRGRGGGITGGGGITLVVEDEAELEEGMEIIIHAMVEENGNFGIRGGLQGVYDVKDGVIEKLDMTLDQFRNLVDEVICQEESKDDE